MAIRPSKFWWDRAEEARAQLEGMKDPEARQAMQLVVTSYEKIARITEAKEVRKDRK